MSKSYYSLGLMSGTSMDGVDASVIQTDGKSKYKAILDKYFEYPKSIYNNLTTLRDKIKNLRDLKKYQKQIKSIEKEITIFHAKAANKILKKTRVNVEFIGFHGQTIFHNAEEKISKQLGDGKFLSELTKKKVIYDFRKNDLKKGGHGAPLAPIFHGLLVKKYNLEKPLAILNIGGIANATFINIYNKIYSADIGPGNCLIDQWIKFHSKNNYDKEGLLAKSGKIKNKFLDIIFDNILIYKGQRSFDSHDFNLSFLKKKMSIKDGAATITEFTALILSGYIIRYLQTNHKLLNILVCGGGRKNKFLLDRVSKITGLKVTPIDKYGIKGDFVESQAFAYLAIRSYLKLPISFPKTTGCSRPCTGGVIVKNF
jgi:anhydro-N-acetylmuramic acid kinase